MIPQEFRTDKVERLQAIVDSFDGDVSRLEELKEDDLKLIGHFVHLYNFIELNLRRSVQAFASAGLLGDIKPRRYRRFAPADLIKTVKEVVSRLELPTSDIEDAHRKLDEIEERWKVRNIFAHWAGRRVPKEDGIFFMSLDARDEKQIMGTDYSDDDSTPNFTLSLCMDLADLRDLALHMMPYGEWIAIKARDWSLQYDAPPPG